MAGKWPTRHVMTTFSGGLLGWLIEVANLHLHSAGLPTIDGTMSASIATLGGALTADVALAVFDNSSEAINKKSRRKNLRSLHEGLAKRIEDLRTTNPNEEAEVVVLAREVFEVTGDWQSGLLNDNEFEEELENLKQRYLDVARQLRTNAANIALPAPKHDASKN